MDGSLTGGSCQAKVSLTKGRIESIQMLIWVELAAAELVSPAEVGQALNFAQVLMGLHFLKNEAPSSSQFQSQVDSNACRRILPRLQV